MNDSILKIIEKSGNGFHLKVAKHLESLGWEATVGQYYADPVTDKPREIDILAQKKFSIGDSGQRLSVRLFAECKYVDNDNVLWFVEKDMKKTKDLIQENQIMRDCADTELMVTEELKARPHHYLKNEPVAKLNAKSGNVDIFYDGTNGSLHSLISLENYNYESYRLDYPIIILDSFKRTYRVAEDSTNKYEKIENNFQLGVDYSYLKKDRQINKYFLIDVVSFDLLDDFLEELRMTDIQIAKDIIIDKIREQIFNERFNSNRRDDDFDPYSPI